MTVVIMINIVVLMLSKLFIVSLNNSAGSFLPGILTVIIF